jgi:hypothetical protein
MIAMADHDHLNPWTRHFAKLALGVPPGISTAQDAFRSALLSLSAYDLGYRITMATGMTRADVHRNPIVKLSQEFWDETKTLLDCIVDEVQTPFSLSVDDLSLAACVALSHRDVSRVAATIGVLLAQACDHPIAAPVCVWTMAVLPRVRGGNDQHLGRSRDLP